MKGFYFDQVAYLQTQVMQTKAQLAQTVIEHSGEIEWTGNFNLPTINNNNYNQSQSQSQSMMMKKDDDSAVSPQSSLESSSATANNNDETLLFMNFEDNTQYYCRSSPVEQQFPTKILPSSSCHPDLGELQALALRMMRN